MNSGDLVSETVYLEDSLQHSAVFLRLFKRTTLICVTKTKIASVEEKTAIRKLEDVATHGLRVYSDYLLVREHSSVPWTAYVHPHPGTLVSSVFFRYLVDSSLEFAVRLCAAARFLTACTLGLIHFIMVERSSNRVLAPTVRPLYVSDLTASNEIPADLLCASRYTLREDALVISLEVCKLSSHFSLL